MILIRWLTILSFGYLLFVNQKPKPVLTEMQFAETGEEKIFFFKKLRKVKKAEILI